MDVVCPHRVEYFFILNVYYAAPGLSFGFAAVLIWYLSGPRSRLGLRPATLIPPASLKLGRDASRFLVPDTPRSRL